MSPDHSAVYASASRTRVARRTHQDVKPTIEIYSALRATEPSHFAMMAQYHTFGLLRPDGAAIERTSNCRVGKIDESSCFRRSFETQTSQSRFLCREDDGCCRS